MWSLKLSERVAESPDSGSGLGTASGLSTHDPAAWPSAPLGSFFPWVTPHDNLPSDGSHRAAAQNFAKLSSAIYMLAIIIRWPRQYFVSGLVLLG